MSEEKNVGLYVGALITSVIGVILFLLTDFASWYSSSSYVETWGWVGFDAAIGNFDLLGILLYVLVTLGFFYCIGVSLGYLTENENVRSYFTLKNGLIISVIIFVVVLVGGLYFVVVMLSDEPDEWGFGAGFYGVFIGSGLTALLFYLASKGDKFRVVES